MPLHVETVGSGAPLVLLHGWAMHGGVWQSAVVRLAGSNRVHVVDLPGHGYSPLVTPYTLDGMVSSLDAHFADEAAPLTVLGWSLGGLVAMQWALRHPERINRLILLCTSPCFVQREDWPLAMSLTILKRFKDELQTHYRATLQRFLNLQVRDSEGGRASLALLRAHLFERGQPGAGTLEGGLEILIQTDLRSQLRKIAQRSLVVSGDRDMLAPPRAGEWLAKRLPDARFIVIQNAAHTPFLSHAEQFHAAIATALGNE